MIPTPQSPTATESRDIGEAAAFEADTWKRRHRDWLRAVPFPQRNTDAAGAPFARRSIDWRTSALVRRRHASASQSILTVVVNH